MSKGGGFVGLRFPSKNLALPLIKDAWLLCLEGSENESSLMTVVCCSDYQLHWFNPSESLFPLAANGQNNSNWKWSFESLEVYEGIRSGCVLSRGKILLISTGNGFLKTFEFRHERLIPYLQPVFMSS
jgi:hypothetical protein